MAILTASVQAEEILSAREESHGTQKERGDKIADPPYAGPDANDRVL
jgi:hypothetical protein